MRYAKSFVLIKRKTGKGKTVWYYRLRGEKTKHSTGIDVKWRAEQWVEREVLGLGRSPEHMPTVREYTEGMFLPGCRWVAHQRAMGRSFSDAKARDRRGHLVNHVWPRWGKQRVDALRGVDIERGIMAIPRTSGTRNNIINTLRIVFRELVREGYLERSPMEDVQRPGDDHRPHGAFTLPELAVLFPRDRQELVRIWGGARWAVLHYLMVCTGLRTGEAAALQWRHHLPDRSAVVIRQALTADRLIGPPKGGNVRAVVYPSRAGDLLAWWRSQTPFFADDDWVFPGPTGNHLATSTIYRRLTGEASRGKPGVLERVGIDPGDRVLTTHSLRVTYNTLMRPLLPEGVLQYMMGHKSRAMTDRYDQSTPEQRVGDLLAPVQGLIDGAWE